MAEATLTPVELGITQPEDPELPDSQPTEPESQQQEQEEDFSDVLSLLDESEEVKGDKPAVPSEGTGPSSTKPKSEAEVEQEVENKLAAREVSRLRQRAVDGARENLHRLDTDISQYLEARGITQESDVKVLKDRILQFNGHWNTVYQADVEGAKVETAGVISTNIVQAIEIHVGKDAVEEIRSANHHDWGGYLEDFAEHYAKKKGLKSAAEVKDAVKAGQTALLKRFKDMGVEIPRGGEGHIPAARSGSSGTRMSKAAFEALSIPEQLAVPGAERARIYADDAAAQARNNRP